MSRSEGLSIPVVHPEHILTAQKELEPAPFLMFREKQRYLRGWIFRQLEKHDQRLVLAGQEFPVLALQEEAVIAYGAMQHAYHANYRRDLPRVAQGTIINYFQNLCPDSNLHPVTHEPLDPVGPETGTTIAGDFVDQQLYLVGRLHTRFGDTEALSSGALFIGMAHAMINAQLALPPEPQNGGH